MGHTESPVGWLMVIHQLEKRMPVIGVITRPAVMACTCFGVMMVTIYAMLYQKVACAYRNILNSNMEKRIQELS